MVLAATRSRTEEIDLRAGAEENEGKDCFLGNPSQQTRITCSVYNYNSTYCTTVLLYAVCMHVQ